MYTAVVAAFQAPSSESNPDSTLFCPNKESNSFCNFEFISVDISGGGGML